MRNIIFGMLVIAAFAFIVNCGDDNEICGIDQSAQIDCLDDFCADNEDAAQCKTADADDDDDVEVDCTDELKKSLQCMADNFECDTETGGMTADSAVKYAECIAGDAGDEDDDDDDDDDNDDG